MLAAIDLALALELYFYLNLVFFLLFIVLSFSFFSFFFGFPLRFLFVVAVAVVLALALVQYFYLALGNTGLRYNTRWSQPPLGVHHHACVDLPAYLPTRYTYTRRPPYTTSRANGHTTPMHAKRNELFSGVHYY